MLNYSKGFPNALTSRVSQDSCISPLVFIAYVNDFDFQLKCCNVNKDPDDFKIYKVILKHNSQIATSALQADLNAFYQRAIN